MLHHARFWISRLTFAALPLVAFLGGLVGGWRWP